ncbi:myb domain protein isoform X2 [Tasmannia lanceolata]|uniref:myb domain protein isoform X2 n=1 Tax=Tasmannia lanceolata TaxID=3420 RepID=UPI0040637581
MRPYKTHASRDSPSTHLRAIREEKSQPAIQEINIFWHGHTRYQFNVEVEFSDGSIFHLSAEFLRIYSPAADSKIRSVGGEKVIFGRRHVGIMSAEPVGNYGVRIAFDDLHKTGIYTWDYFYHLGTNKFTLMRNYIQTLKKHGLSRDPQRKK